MSVGLGWLKPVMFLKNLRLNPVAVCLLIGLVAFAAVLVLEHVDVFQGRELQAFDQLLRLSSHEPIDARIVLIRETEDDIRRYGHPLSDQVFADALQRLENVGAKVIGVDKYRDVPIAPGSGALNAVLQRYDNIIWIFFAGNSPAEFISAPSVLAQNHGRIGFNDVVEDPDGVMRRGLLFLDVNNESYYAFPLLLALHYLASENISTGSDNAGYFSLNGVSLPPIDENFAAYRQIDAGGYQIILKYPGLPQEFTAFNLSELLDGKIPDASLRDKIILIGGAAPSLPDYRLLPNKIRRFAVESHAFFVSQLLHTAFERKPPIQAWPDSGEHLWMLIWCWIGALSGLYRGSLRFLLFLFVAGALLLLLSNYLLLSYGWWTPLIAPLSGWSVALAMSVFYSLSLARHERHQIMRLFASHVSPEVAARLWEIRAQFFAEGRVRPDILTATVMFTDLANFTAVAESMEPLVLMDWLNEYMEEMSEIVTEHGGIVNKYIGDAIMAIFGVPVKRETEDDIAADAQRALQCALAFNLRLLELNRKWQARDLPAITMRAGIYTGPLVAGSFGGSLRMEYTVIGDTVNIASRLESFDKNMGLPGLEHPCRILIGESTYNYVRDFCDTNMVGEYQLKGKNKKINIYHVLR